MSGKVHVQFLKISSLIVPKAIDLIELVVEDNYSFEFYI